LIDIPQQNINGILTMQPGTIWGKTFIVTRNLAGGVKVTTKYTLKRRHDVGLPAVLVTREFDLRPFWSYVPVRVGRRGSGRNRWFKLDTEHKSDIENSHALVRLHDNRGSSATRVQDPFRVWNRHARAVGQHQRKRPERLRVNRFMQAFGSHFLPPSVST
jgi:hypothetical protein